MGWGRQMRLGMGARLKGGGGGYTAHYEQQRQQRRTDTTKHGGDGGDEAAVAGEKYGRRLVRRQGGLVSVQGAYVLRGRDL